MPKGRFSEKQIINVLKEHQGGHSGCRVVPQARDPRRDVLHLALEIRRHGGIRCPQAEGARGWKPQTEEAVGGVDTGRGDAARGSRKKLLTASSRRVVVTWAIEEKGYSQRRVCAL